MLSPPLPCFNKEAIENDQLKDGCPTRSMFYCRVVARNASGLSVHAQIPHNLLPQGWLSQLVLHRVGLAAALGFKRFGKA